LIQPILSRRELLRYAGISVAGTFPFASNPARVTAAESKPKIPATARQVIFVMLDGGFSHVDGFDAKEGPWTPKEFEIKSFGNDVRMPSGLFKRLPSMLDKVAIIRSMNAWDAVHGRAQYYLQTGHPLNLALAKEVPSVGSVIGHEFASQRKESDSLPAFVALNGISSQAGLITQGFLPAEFAPLNLQVEPAGPPRIAPDKSEGAEDSFHRRWELLQKLDGSLRAGEGKRGRSFVDYHDYYRGAHAMMNDPRVPGIFSIADDEKKRYGASAIGNSLILARNLVKANAGTRFVLAGHGGWDFHTDIYTEGKRNHQTLSRELDHALTSLLEDLIATPSTVTPGKSMFDETLVVCMSEFGRTPGPVTESRVGREHYMWAGCGLMAGAGVRGGLVLGKTDDKGEKVVDPGWSGKRPMYVEDIVMTMYAALGIDYSKSVSNTPSGRSFHYIEPASGTKYVRFQPVIDLFQG
jgi:hypothetical protein